MSDYEAKFNWNGIPEPRIEVTLHDKMAIAALGSMSLLTHGDPIHIAQWAYSYADAMMRVRNE